MSLIGNDNGILIFGVFDKIHAFLLSICIFESCSIIASVEPMSSPIQIICEHFFTLAVVFSIRKLEKLQHWVLGKDCFHSLVNTIVFLDLPSESRSNPSEVLILYSTESIILVKESLDSIAVDSMSSLSHANQFFTNVSVVISRKISVKHGIINHALVASLHVVFNANPVTSLECFRLGVSILNTIDRDTKTMNKPDLIYTS